MQYCSAYKVIDRSGRDYDKQNSKIR